MRERLNRCINILSSGVRDPSSELSRSDMFSKGCWFSIIPVNNSSNCSVCLFAGLPPLFLQQSFLSLFVYSSTKQLDLKQHCKSELKRFFPYQYSGMWQGTRDCNCLYRLVVMTRVSVQRFSVLALQTPGSTPASLPVVRQQQSAFVITVVTRPSWCLLLNKCCLVPTPVSLCLQILSVSTYR